MAKSTGPTRVFLDLQPVGHRKPAGADPFTYRDPRPARWRASWWLRRPHSELYRSKVVATREEAVRLARAWLDRQNKPAGFRGLVPADAQLVDTTDQPERFGYSHDAPAPAPAEKKSPAQLDAEIAEALAKEGR